MSFILYHPVSIFYKLGELNSSPSVIWLHLFIIFMNKPFFKSIKYSDKQFVINVKDKFVSVPI